MVARVFDPTVTRTSLRDRGWTVREFNDPAMVMPRAEFASLALARKHAARDLPGGTAVQWVSSGGITIGGFVGFENAEITRGHTNAERALDHAGTLTPACCGPRYHSSCAARVQPAALVRWDGFRAGWERPWPADRSSGATPSTQSTQACSSTVGVTASVKDSRPDSAINRTRRRPCAEPAVGAWFVANQAPGSAAFHSESTRSRGPVARTRSTSPVFQDA